jgi:hypothetical protein
MRLSGRDINLAPSLAGWQNRLAGEARAGRCDREAMPLGFALIALGLTSPLPTQPRR